MRGYIITLTTENMDFKIQFGLICVAALIVVCHGNGETPPTTKTPGADAGTDTGTVSGNGTGGAGKGGSDVTATPATTPAPITCHADTCPGNCSTFTQAKTCASDTTNGCKTVIGAKGAYTYSCNTGACTASDTVKCCNVANCNTYAAAQPQSKATTMFANLLSTTLAVMLVSVCM